MEFVVNSDTEIWVYLRPLSSHQYFRFALIMYHRFCRVQIKPAQLHERNEILTVGRTNYILQKYCFLAREFIRRSNKQIANKISIICENIVLNPFKIFN